MERRRTTGRTAACFIFAFAMIIFGFASTAPASGYKVSTDKSTYYPYDAIKVDWEAPDEHDLANCVVILPSSTNAIPDDYGREDWEDIIYLGDDYGSDVWDGPSVPGSYDYRIYDTLQGGGLLAQTTISVAAGGGAITLAKNNYQPGEALTINYSYTPNFPVDSFLAMVPASLVHNNSQLACDNDLIQSDNQDRIQRIGSFKQGEREFAAPSTPGSYEIRMYDNLDPRGNEICAAAFTVNGLSGSAAPAGGSIPAIQINGQKLQLDVAPVIENGRTLVPMGAIFKALGASIEWNQATQTVTAVKDGTQIILAIGGSAYKNGQAVSLDVPAKIVQGRTMVPLAFISQSLGAQVQWLAESRTVVVNTSTASAGDTTPNTGGSSSPPAAAGGSWTGSWDTGYDGIWELTQSGSRVTGTYDNNRGRISGMVSGPTLTGTWAEGAGEAGNTGPFEVTMDSGGAAFTGRYWFDVRGSDDEAKTWNGVKIS